VERSTRLSVVDRTLTIIADSDTHRVGSRDTRANLVSLLHAPGEVYFEYSRDGRRFFHLSRSLRGSRESTTDPAILAAISLDVDLTAAERHLRDAYVRSMLGLLALLIAFAGFQSLVLRRLFVRPVQALAAAARQIGQGDLDARVTVASHDELGQLAAD